MALAGNQPKRPLSSPWVHSHQWLRPAPNGGFATLLLVWQTNQLIGVRYVSILVGPGP
jgi:hypothetical protein